MKKKLFAATVAIVMSVAIAGPVSAKAPTAKITITGGRLTRPLEVTDPQVLSSFNPWFGGFMDLSRRVVTAPPGGPQRYEVSFYVKFSNDDIQMKYVLYYHPSPSNEQGYIYLPGRSEKWYQLNASTIIRKTGWYYTSRDWEALVKPLIAGAEAAQHHGSGR